MRRIFRYELRRLLLNKFFLGLMVVTGLYSYQILSGDIIRGIAYTAPFSAWSYGAYISGILPVLLITLLFFITFLYDRKEKQVETITHATPVDQRAYRAVRYAAMAVGFCVVTALSVVISLVFYASVFGYTGFGAFVTPLLMTVIPAMLLIFGLGILLGKVHVGLVYGLMLLMLVAGFIPLPPALDILGGRFFAQTPLTLPVGADGEPAFVVPTAVALVRVLAALVGAGLVAWGIAGRQKRILVDK